MKIIMMKKIMMKKIIEKENNRERNNRERNNRERNNRENEFTERINYQEKLSLDLQNMYVKNNFMLANYVNKAYVDMLVSRFNKTDKLFNCLYLEFSENNGEIDIGNSYGEIINDKYEKSNDKDIQKFISKLTETEKDIYNKSYTIDNYSLILSSFHFLDRVLMNSTKYDMVNSNIFIPLLLDNINITDINDDKYIICYLYVNMYGKNKCDIFLIPYLLTDVAIEKLSEYINKLVNKSIMKQKYNDNVKYKETFVLTENSNSNNLEDINNILLLTLYHIFNSYPKYLDDNLKKKVNENSLINFMKKFKKNERFKEATKNNKLTKQYENTNKQQPPLKQQQPVKPVIQQLEKKQQPVKPVIQQLEKKQQPVKPVIQQLEKKQSQLKQQQPFKPVKQQQVKQQPVKQQQVKQQPVKQQPVKQQQVKQQQFEIKQPIKQF